MNRELVQRAMTWLARVECMSYRFRVTEGHGGVHLQGAYMEQDIYKGPGSSPEEQLTRKWLLSPHMTESEMIQTAFKCVLTSMEHRTREHFKYKNARIFGPHFNVNDLVRLCHTGRDNAGGRK